jgi:hypothetical protein
MAVCLHSRDITIEGERRPFSNMVSLQPIPIIRPSHLPQIIHIHWHDNHGNRDEQGTQENL